MGIAGKLAQAFIRSKLTPIIILVSLALGSFSVLTTPKEEEPQIVVPMIDIFISYPGATPEEVERRVVTPLEKKLWELKDIEYIYSASMDGMAIVTARFYVGTDPTKALVDLNTKMMSAMDLAPPGVMLPPLIKPKSIDDVPILTLTIWGKDYDWYELRRIASSIENEIKKVNNVADVFVVGGRPRQMKIILDPNKLSSYKLSVLHVANAIRSANSELSSGKISQSDRELYVRAGEFLKSRSDIENLLVAVIDSRPVFIKDIATVEDGPEDISNYVFMGLGPAHKEAGFNQGEMYPAVSIAVAKRVGTNAVNVAKEVLSVVEHIKKTQLPADLKITVTRNYGETAEEKANTLIKKLLIATFSVILLMAVALGVREAIVVGIAVPVTLAIAMFLSQVFGFTINRVTLFALIFAIGILVDDAIVVVENIHRWFELKLAKDPQEAIVKATDEVGNPTVLATFTVIAALMPMAFVSGLMGPYMRPIPINASVAMFFSLIVAFIITPWASYILLRDQFTKREAEKDHKTGAYWRFYSSIMAPMLASN
ncbi:MAG: efflux RND transporter permease subunit, partial [Aquificaceae bacterium]